MPSPSKKQLEARRQEVRVIKQNHERMFNFPVGAPFCHPDWVANVEENPRRTRWVSSLATPVGSLRPDAKSPGRQ